MDLDNFYLCIFRVLVDPENSLIIQPLSLDHHSQHMAVGFHLPRGTLRISQGNVGFL